MARLNCYYFPGFFRKRPPLDHMPLLLHHFDYLIHVFRAQLLSGGFYHDPDHWLCARLAQENAAVAAQSLGHFGCLGLNQRIVLGGLFVVNADIFQNLGENLYFGGQLAQGLLLLQHA